MRSRYASSSSFGSSFGPGPLTPGIRALIIANVAMLVIGMIVPEVTLRLGLVPAGVIEDRTVWQLVSYMFLHAGIFHILFNMLTLWMFGVELERRWGTRFFLKYYFYVGIGAGLTQVLASLVPVAPLEAIYFMRTIGASGAIYGLLLAYALYFPERQIYMSAAVHLQAAALRVGDHADGGRRLGREGRGQPEECRCGERH